MNTVRKAEILLPQVDDMEKWAVVSCDQFTSQRKYWETLKDTVGESDSALKLIFPEVYLGDRDAAERTKNINATMQRYLAKGLFKPLKDSFVLVKRDTSYGASTLGIIVSVDLEQYSFLPKSEACVRATEGFVPDRIPPRLKIRENAPLELPHIILLIDDRKKQVIEKFYENVGELEKLYDFNLNMRGGHIAGWRIDSSSVICAFQEFEKSVKGIYGIETNFLFAVGDGNHSLATAKTHWDLIKGNLSEAERETHPARFALVEVQNLHSDGLKFEPIFRCVFGVDEMDFIAYLRNALSGEGSIELFSRHSSYTLSVNENSAAAIAEVQGAIDGYLKAHARATVDYIHGIEHLKQVADESDGIAFVTPKIKKEELFGYILDHGALCRKAFSMGEAEGKRYYLEAKKIK